MLADPPVTCLVAVTHACCRHPGQLCCTQKTLSSTMMTHILRVVALAKGLVGVPYSWGTQLVSFLGQTPPDRSQS